MRETHAVRERERERERERGGGGGRGEGWGKGRPDNYTQTAKRIPPKKFTDF